LIKCLKISAEQKSASAQTTEQQYVREIRRASALVRRHRAKARSILVVLGSEELLTIAQFAAAPSFLWFTAIQSIKGEERLADLSPQSCFVAAEPI